MQFLRLIKEAARLRGELQNDSISGISSDELQLIKDNINKEQRMLATKRPPFLHKQFHLKMKKSITLDDSSGDNTATATRGIPRIVDTNSNLNTRHKYWLLSDGTYRHRAVSLTGITYTLDYAVAVTATTNNTWVAYKDTYALPHNCGPIENVFLEDGDGELDPVSGVAFHQFFKEIARTGDPFNYSRDVFTNTWDPYKFQVTAITATNGSNQMDVGTTTASHFDIGDNVILDTATTNEYLHTVTGLDESNGLIFLDRNYNGDTGQVTLKVNPVEVTRYLSLYPIPDGSKDIIIDYYIKPQPLVNDTDECIFDWDGCWAIVFGAIMQDNKTRSVLTPQQLDQYTQYVGEMMKTKNAKIVVSPRGGGVLGGSRRFRTSRIN